MKTQKTIGAAVLSLSLLVGLSGFAGAVSGSVSNTGPDSYNTIKSETNKRVRVYNNNRLRVDNDNRQSAHTGDAKVIDNTTGGDARTGAASNANSLNVSATVNNASSASAWAGVGGGGGGSNHATINQTGPDSTNKIKFEDTTRVTVNNTNNVNVDNDNHQTATSGDAKVIHNTTGGDAVTGNASNTNNTTVKLDVRN